MSEQQDDPVFPIFSLDTQSEMIANSFHNNGLMDIKMAANSNFYEEGSRESDTTTNNNICKERPIATEKAGSSAYEEEPRATDYAVNNISFEGEHTELDVGGSSAIIEEGPRICPICGSVIKFFFMNFNEKLLMCENVECDFPFGYEDLQIVKVDTGVDFSEEFSTFNSTSTKSKIPRSSPTTSVISGSAWSDINKVTRDSEGSQFDSKSGTTTASEREDKLRAQMAAKEKQDKILQNLNDIKQINAALKETKDQPKTNIRNEKWLHNMKSLEGMSGVKLLTRKEKDKLKGTQPQHGISEFKIDIGTANNDNSSIKIHITNSGQLLT